MNQSKQIRRFGPLTYSVLAIAIVLVVVVRVLPQLGIGVSLVPGGVLWPLIVSLPLLIVWFVGIALIVKRWHRHPQVSRCAFIAIGALVIVWVATYLSDVWLQATFRGGARWSNNAIMTYQILRSFVPSILKAGCWILLIAAILGWRERRTQGERIDGQELESHRLHRESGPAGGKMDAGNVTNG